VKELGRWVKKGNGRVWPNSDDVLVPLILAESNGENSGWIAIDISLNLRSPTPSCICRSIVSVR